LTESDSSVVSILGVCLDGFDGDAWMSDPEGAHDEIQAGAGAGVNDPDDILWCVTSWSAGGEDAGSVKTSKKTGEGRKQSSLALSGKTVTLDPQKAAIGENGNGDRAVGGGVTGEGGGVPPAGGMSHGQQRRAKS